MSDITQREVCKEINCEKHIHCTECNSAYVTWNSYYDWAKCRSCKKDFRI